MGFLSLSRKAFAVYFGAIFDFVSCNSRASQHTQNALKQSYPRQCGFSTTISFIQSVDYFSLSLSLCRGLSECCNCAAIVYTFLKFTFTFLTPIFISSHLIPFRSLVRKLTQNQNSYPQFFASDAETMFFFAWLSLYLYHFVLYSRQDLDRNARVVFSHN